MKVPRILVNVLDKLYVTGALKVQCAILECVGIDCELQTRTRYVPTAILPPDTTSEIEFDTGEGLPPAGQYFFLVHKQNVSHMLLTQMMIIPRRESETTKMKKLYHPVKRYVIYK